MVETAIIAPVLIFMLIGVFEVGWALRGYLVLASANREAARFAVRGNYLSEFSEAEYGRVVSQAFNSLSNQIPFQSGGTVIVSHFFVNTGYICDPEDDSLCDCDQAVTDPFSTTLIMTPLNVPTYTYKWPATSTKITQLDYGAYISELVEFDLQFNCQLVNRGAQFSTSSVIVVEMFYDQPQLMGFPLISNPFTDPVPMYTHTAMRRVTDRNTKTP